MSSLWKIHKIFSMKGCDFFLHIWPSTSNKMHKFFYGQKKYAYLDNRNPASETDIVRALFLTNSKTLQHLAKITGGKENLIKEMKNMKKKHLTSTLWWDASSPSNLFNKGGCFWWTIIPFIPSVFPEGSRLNHLPGYTSLYPTASHRYMVFSFTSFRDVRCRSFNCLYYMSIPVNSLLAF